MVLQIAFPVNSLFLERSALPPGCALCVRNPGFRYLLGLMFSAACGLFCALGALFAHACLCFQPLTDSFAKHRGVGVVSADEGATADAPLADGDACGTAGRAVAEHSGANRRSRGSVLHHKTHGWHRRAASGRARSIAD